MTHWYDLLPGTVEVNGNTVATFDSGSTLENKAAAIAHAWKVGGLPHVVVNPNYKDKVLLDCECKQESDSLSVTFPMGIGKIRAVNIGGKTPSQINGSLKPPTFHSGWTFQPNCITYEDGTTSGFLGMYPMDIVWESDPRWNKPALK